VIVDVREPLQVASAQPGIRSKEPVVDRVLGQLAVKGDESVTVVGGYRPDLTGASVAEYDVGLPGQGIAGGWCG
jgi:hypothetical protein